MDLGEIMRFGVRKWRSDDASIVETSSESRLAGIAAPTPGSDSDLVGWARGDSAIGHNVSYLREEDSSIYFGNLLRNHRDFVAEYPEIVQDFLGAFEHRRSLPGFPEFALGEHALAAVLEAMFKDEPTEGSLAKAHALPTRSKLYSNPVDGRDVVADYMADSGGILSRIALTRPLVIMGFCRNLHRVREDVVRYVAALHIEYASRRNDAPL